MARNRKDTQEPEGVADAMQDALLSRVQVGVGDRTGEVGTVVSVLRHSVDKIPGTQEVRYSVEFDDGTKEWYDSNDVAVADNLPDGEDPEGEGEPKTGKAE